MIERRDQQAWAYALIGVVGAFAIVIGPILFFGPRHPHGPIVIDPVRVVVSTLATGLGVAWATWFSRLSFIRFDEFLQEASKFAWYWGSALGIAVSAPIYVFIGSGGLHWLDPARPVGRELFFAFVLGYCVLLIPQVLCVVGIHLLWKRTHR